MRWPWVSRRAYDDLARSGQAVIARVEEVRALYDKSESAVAMLRGLLDAADLTRGDYKQRAVVAEEAAAAERKRFDDLLARYHMLKLQGAVVVEPAGAPVIAKADPVRTAIARAARGSEELIRQMEVAAERDRAAGLSDGEIVRRIRAGNRVQSEFEVPTTPTPSGDASVS